MTFRQYFLLDLSVSAYEDVKITFGEGAPIQNTFIIKQWTYTVKISWYMCRTIYSHYQMNMKEQTTINLK